MTKTKTKSVAPEDSALFLGNQLCFALYAASLAMSKTYRPLLAPLGLTFPQYVVMMALWEHKQLTAGALAQTVALDAGTLVPLVRKLVEAGIRLTVLELKPELAGSCPGYEVVLDPAALQDCNKVGFQRQAARG